MLLDLELGALGKYLNPSKAKLESKGVDSVVSRVCNLKEINPTIDHHTFSDALTDAFVNKWSSEGSQVNVHDLKIKDLEAIPKLMQAYD